MRSPVPTDAVPTDEHLFATTKNLMDAVVAIAARPLFKNLS